MSPARAPRAALALLARLPPDREALAGDLLEEFNRGRSRIWFWHQVLFALGVELFRGKRETTHGLGQPHALIRRFEHAATIDLNGTGTRWVGGSGLAFLALLIMAVVPQFWLLLASAVAGGAAFGIVLIILRRRILCIALVATASAVVFAQEFHGGAQSRESPLAGTWVADLSTSTLHKGSPMRSATLRFIVTSESVSITDTTRDASGKEIGTGTTVFVTDGTSHPHDALLSGLTVVAAWRTPRLLETVLTWKSGQVDRVTYEVSDDGKTLTTRTSGPLGDQTILFHRK